jgi:threonine dehydratase
MSSHADFKAILTTNVYDVAKVSPLEKANGLSDYFTNEILLKRDDLQPTFSFKIRGVYNKMKKLSKTCTNYICASTGNKGYAAAYSAKKLGCLVKIIVPKTVSSSKIKPMQDLGAEVILHGDTYIDAKKHAKDLADSGNYNYLDGSSDSEMIAGYGTIGMEIINQLGDNIETLDSVFLPLDYGLITGIKLYVKTLHPHVKFIGITSTDEPNNDAVNLCKDLLDSIVEVNTDEICSAIKYIHDDTRGIMEMSGAISVAGLIKHIDTHGINGQKFIALTTSSNMNFDKLKFIIDRADIDDSTKCVLKIAIPEKQNSLVNLLNAITNNEVNDTLNITKFHYRFSSNETAYIIFGFTVSNSIGSDYIIEIIKRNGYQVEKQESTNLTRLHSSFLMNGFGNKLENEYIFSFNFPERPNALHEFLDSLGLEVNISLFHYNYTGDYYGNVLMGLQIKDNKYDMLIDKLKEITFISYTDETNNPSLYFFK